MTTTTDTPVRRGRWSGRCPLCTGGRLYFSKTTPAIQCDTCPAKILPPPREHEMATSEIAIRTTDRRASWDDYSAPGGLLSRWGRSTQRADGSPPKDLDAHEDMPPRILSQPIRGAEDAILDALVAEYTAHTEGLVRALDNVIPLGKRLYAEVFGGDQRAWKGNEGKAKRRRTEWRPPSEGWPDAEGRAALRRVVSASSAHDGAERLDPPHASEPVPGHQDDEVAPEVLGRESRHRVLGQSDHAPDSAPTNASTQAPALVSDLDRHLFRDTYGPRPVSPEPLGPYARILSAPPAVLLGVVQALAILADNALRARGVERPGGLEQVRPVMKRSTPFAGFKHALSVAWGVTDRGESSPIPRSALAEHPLPQGLVFGQISCHPSRNYGPQREPDTGATDVWAAIQDARVGARTYYESGKQRSEPGRALSRVELELVRLVDVGRLNAKATVSHKGRRTRVETLAVEPLHPRDALEVLRKRGVEGVPRTEKEASIMLRAVRHAIRIVLEERGLIPGNALEEVEVDEEQEQVVVSGDRRRGRRVA